MEKGIVWITGGAQGIGKGIAHHLLTLGWTVVISDIDSAAGVETEEELTPLGSVLFLPADVAEESEVVEAVRRMETTYGCLHGLVNSAGIASPGRTPLESLSLAEWDRVLRVNLTGTFLVTRHAVPLLRRADRGAAVVNLASTRALQSEPDSFAYSASKGGILALTHSLAVSLGPEIRVNCISPGWIETAEWQKSSRRKVPLHSEVDRTQHPVGRVGRPQDVASVAAFLLSEEAGFITGQNIVVDGGMTIRMIYA